MAITKKRHQEGGQGYEEFVQLCHQFASFRLAFMAATPTAQQFFIREIAKDKAGKDAFDVLKPERPEPRSGIADTG